MSSEIPENSLQFIRSSGFHRVLQAVFEESRTGLQLRRCELGWQRW